MDEDARQLLLRFYRTWSTLEITERSRFHFRQDAVGVEVLLESLGSPVEIDLKEERSRMWYAENVRRMKEKERASSPDQA